MPAIQSELRVQVQGGQAPLLVKRDLLEVNSCEQISLYVDGVKPEKKPEEKKADGQQAQTAVAQRPGAKKKAAKKPKKNVVTGSYKLELANVKFVAIYDAGQASGLKVKVPGAKFQTLTQPMVFMDRAAKSFGSKPTILLENESLLPRTAVMLVGSDLARDAKEIKQVKRDTAPGQRSAKKAKKKTQRQAKQQAQPQPKRKAKKRAQRQAQQRAQPRAQKKGKKKAKKK